jgi:hypothetical protein
MNMNKLPETKSRGPSMVVVMVALAVLLIITAGLLSLGLRGQMRSIRSSEQIIASSAADTGLMLATFEMNERLKGTWNPKNLPHATNMTLANTNAHFSYDVTGDLDSGYIIQSVGSSGDARRMINANLRLRGLFDYGILVKKTIKLHKDTLVDAYDSSNSAVTDVPLQIATVSIHRSDIRLKPGATVDGDILRGVDSDFPAVSVPALPDMGGAIDVLGTTRTIGPANSGKYAAINVGPGGGKGMLVIDAGAGGGEVVLHITGDIRIGQDCEVTIKPNTSLVIYLNGDLVSGNSASINNETESSTNFTLYGIGENQYIELKAKTKWYGAVYAPEADINIKANGDIYGSFVGTTFENKASGRVVYDVTLREVDVTDEHVRFVINCWFEQ